MLERDGYPAGVPCWVDSGQPDPEAAVRFYGGLFGAAGPAVWNTYVWVESADDAAAKVVEAGGTVVTAPFDVADAGRMAVFADPSGATFCVWEARAHKGAALVNEPGTWNVSELNTREWPTSALPRASRTRSPGSSR